MKGGWVISYGTALRWMPLDLTDDKSTLVQIMAWCRQATSHYLSQCWTSSMSPYGVTRPQWVKPLKTRKCLPLPVPYQCRLMICRHSFVFPKAQRHIKSQLINYILEQRLKPMLCASDSSVYMRALLLRGNAGSTIIEAWQRLNALMIVSRLYYIAIQKHVLPSVHYSDVNINICISTE